ncbi:MAG TPA: S1C family serine protease [Thermoleophilaceae bacterium]|nr:S1C family serine protease [Thermoleophilaceae bacterium]
MAGLAEASEFIASTAAKAGDAVVGLGPGWRGGSGVVVADGRVLTASHNLRRDQVSVVFADGRRERAELLGVDRDVDLAVLAVDTAGIEPIPVAAGAADADGARGIGALVVGLARPGGRSLRVTHGFVSTDQRQMRGPRGRRIPAIEHTAPLPRGSSGGPLLDADGKLIGVNVIRLDGGLIVAVDTVALAGDIERLGRGEAPTRRRLGVAVAPPHVARRLRRSVGLPDATGILVRGVEDGSPAAEAGLERGDLLVELDGIALERIDDLYNALDANSDGLSLGVLRGADRRDVRIEFRS